MNVLVIGCGNLGSRLAEVLWHHGHHVSIIDAHEDAFRQLSEDFDGMTVTGVPMDLTVLRNAGIEGCDAVAVVTSDDNLNITISQIVIEFFNIENVVARITDPAREKVFKHFGLRTVCQTKLSCRAMFSALTNEREDQQVTFGTSTVSFQTRDIDPILIGRTLDSIPTRSGEIILGVMDMKGQLQLNHGRKDIILNPDDRLVYTRVID